MSSRKRRKFRVWPILFVLLTTCMVAVAGYSFMTTDIPSQQIVNNVDKVDEDKKIQQKNNQRDTKEQKANSVDFKDASLKLQSEVDRLVQAQKWTVKENAKSEKTVNRSEGKGTIDWWQRTQLISVNSSVNIKQVKDYILAGLKDKKGTILRQENDTYAGQSVIRLDIGLIDSLGGEELNLTIDKVYVMGVTPLPVKKEPKGRLALLIDDAGYEIEPLKKMIALKRDFTFAILPMRTYSKESLSLIKNSGNQAFLHLPMEPLDKAQQSEERTVTIDMTDEQVKKLTAEYIDYLPGIIGVNNHQGSRATADERIMKNALSVIKAKGLVFVDSNTQPKTIARDVAQQMGIRTNINRAFLDGQADVEYIKGRLRQAGKASIDNGYYIAICHVRPKTAIALAEMIDELEEMGVEFVFVSTVLK